MSAAISTVRHFVNTSASAKTHRILAHCSLCKKRLVSQNITDNTVAYYIDLEFIVIVPSAA